MTEMCRVANALSAQLREKLMSVVIKVLPITAIKHSGLKATLTL